MGISNAIWIAPSAISFLYIGIKILFPKYSRYIMVSLIISGILFEISLFINPSEFISYIYPLEPGNDLIEDNYVFGFPSGVIFLIWLFLIILFFGIGLLIKSFQYKGILRKKIIYISFGAFFMVLCAIFDVLAPPGILLILVRFTWIFSLIFIYYGVKEEVEKPSKFESKKEVVIEGELFRLIKSRPSEITEEEITYLKELKKCLICKENAEGFNIYVCPSCDALYCQRCAHALSHLENACWSCNGPIDKSKPVKIKKEEVITPTPKPPTKTT